jgi:peptidylamidoglycolate lyase
MIRFAMLCSIMAAAAWAADTHKVVHGWPQMPDNFAFQEVSGVGIDSHGHVFVFHRGARPVMCFDGATGKLITSWGDGILPRAHGLSIDKQDNVWLTDILNHQVHKFSHNGELLMSIGAKGVPGLGPGHFNQPTDVAVGPNGDIYVSDGYGNNRVARFNSRGEFLGEWGTKGTRPGEFDLPHGIAVDKAGKVYVADRANGRVQIFEANGKFVAQWKSDEIGRPWDVQVAPDGRVFVVDGGDLNQVPPERGRIVILDAAGKKLGQFGRFGSYDGQFYWAHAVDVAPNGDAYVTDVFKGMRVQKFVPVK